MRARNVIVGIGVCSLPVILATIPIAAQSTANDPRAAMIYIYWPKQARGGGKPKVMCDGQHVANLQESRYIALRAAPGTHTIKFHKGDISATFEAGRNHYIRVSAEGFPVHAVLRLMDPDDATTEMQLKDVAPNDPKRTFAAECQPPSPAIPRKTRNR
jgi:hypothetical protein